MHSFINSHSLSRACWLFFVTAKAILAASKPRLGIVIEGKDASSSSLAAVRIVGIATGSAAGISGLRNGDMVVSINDVPTPTTAAFAREQLYDKTGDMMSLLVLRGSDSPMKMTVMMGASNMSPEEFCPWTRVRAAAALQ
jgi:membrane-associated protease RseP (regulator of RpoE activity)